VRPGLTCYWQVGGRNDIAFDEWMRLDLRYVDNWSLAVDVRLILQTVPVVLAGRGAS
jgi:lipopolysaccharide/colanic/teichoic acid biosynthesis glycosyltransferase